MKVIFNVLFGLLFIAFLAAPALQADQQSKAYEVAVSDMVGDPQNLMNPGNRSPTLIAYKGDRLEFVNTYAGPMLRRLAGQSGHPNLIVIENRLIKGMITAYASFNGTLLSGIPDISPNQKGVFDCVSERFSGFNAF